MRTSTSFPCGFGVSTMVSHNGASNLTRDWRRISAMVFAPLRHTGFCGPYIGQFTRHGNKTGNRNGLGAPARIDLRGGGEPCRVDGERLEALAQHLAALAERGGCDLFERTALAGLWFCARHQPYHRGGDLGLRYEGGRRNIEQDFCLGAPVREHCEPAIGLVILMRDDALGHLALE